SVFSKDTSQTEQVLISQLDPDYSRFARKLVAHQPGTSPNHRETCRDAVMVHIADKRERSAIGPHEQHLWVLPTSFCLGRIVVLRGNACSYTITHYVSAS
ncbi:MAG: hypothetical protein FWD57_09630, partial [Polyangiaceae bacterium]|nr:hypothetical protein [Polyangiaceae bacterium]